MKLTPTRHAQTRMDQRGIQRADVEIIVESGTVIRPGLHLLRDRDINREVRECKRRIQALERLRGCAAVVEDGTLITCYHVDGKAGRQALRRNRRRRRHSTDSLAGNHELTGTMPILQPHQN